MTSEALKPVAYLHESMTDSAVITAPVRKLLADCYGDQRVSAYSIPLVPAPSPELVREIAEKYAEQLAVAIGPNAYERIIASAINEALGHEGVKG